MINIIDNFLDQEILTQIEKEIKNNKFEEVKTPGKSFWVQGVNNYLVKYILLRLEIEEGWNKLKSCGAFFREAKEGQDDDWRIHCDVDPIPGQDQPERAVVLYMNETKTDGLNGTALWEHEKYGDSMDMNNLEESKRLLKDESNDLSKWKLKSVIGSKKNRLITYPCNYFHSKYPNEFKESRIVFVMFYKRSKNVE
jgi:hypothetical protein